MALQLRGLHFETSNNNSYYYDDCSGICYPCPDGCKTKLEELEHSDIDSIIQEQKDLTYWERFIASRYLSYGAFFEHPFEINPPNVEELQHKIMTEGMRQLFLIVTSKCNLSCKYCIYSEHYPQTFDSWSDMTYETAVKAVDYYLSNILISRQRIPKKPALINFYGGEPLLNFDLIRKIVHYIRDKNIKNVMYSISTNGVLLNDQVIDFLVQNDFTIAISIDGPREEHDRNRIFPDGRGSFDQVYDNIQNLHLKYPEHAKIVYLVTKDIVSDTDKIRSFFGSHDAFKNKVFFFNSVRDIFTDYNEQFSKEQYEKYCDELNRHRSHIHENVDLNDPYVKYNLVMQYFFYLHRTILMPMRQKEIPSTATCLPGDKLSVFPDGRIQVCERVPGCLKIGSVDQGLDFELITKLINNYNEAITDKCRGCSISRLCAFCLSHFYSGKKFKKPNPVFCESHVVKVKAMLSEVYTLMENNPSLYDELVNLASNNYKLLNQIKG